MPLESWVLTRQIRTISEERMLGLMGRISNEEMQDVIMALHQLPASPGSSAAIGDYPGLV